MAVFKVAPFDQHLYLEDQCLNDNNKTLAELNITPEAVISLRVSLVVAAHLKNN